jgi:hypothetical protein
VSVTDENGCTAEECFEVLEPEELTLVASSLNANCGACDGSVTAVVGGGTAPITVQLIGENVNSSTPPFDELCPGTYEVIVTDDNLCSTSQTVVVGGPQPIIITGNVAQPLCFGDCDGLINVSIENAVEPIEYRQTTSNFTAKSSQNVSTGVTVVKQNKSRQVL